ncbi:MAG: TMEM165/GDT1 family protein [Clostridiales bacterium]|nr:TMEM165/GDT1 family protein [Clostridiales bacterium]
MLFFFKILGTMFVAEMGDKTQLLMVAMTSKYKLKDIILGAGLSIMVLNLIAVAAGSIISTFIPTWLIKIAAAVAFFYFAWSSLKKDDSEEEDKSAGKKGNPMLIVFGTFFIAELGDKTQLTAITFAANEGFSRAVAVWAACCIGLFAADVIGMLVGYLLKSKTPDGFLNLLAFFIFAIFGFTTMATGVGLLIGDGMMKWIIAIICAVVFTVLCLLTIMVHKKAAAKAIINDTKESL